MSRFTTARSFRLVAALVLILGISAFVYKVNTSVEESDDEFVTALTKDTFDSFLDEHSVVLVEFYAPWCGHCKKLAPEFNSAGRMLKENGSAVKLAKIDATQETSLADRYQIRGYPTLYLFRNKMEEEYTGGRLADGIYEWLMKMTGPSVSVVEEDALRALMAGNTDWAINIVGSFKGKDSGAFKVFEKVADAKRQVAKFSAFLSSKDKDEIRVVRGDEEPVTFEGPFTETDLTTFVNDEIFPLFGPVNGENFKSYAERGSEMVWYCGDKSNFESVKSAMREVAKTYKKEYSFIWLDTEQFKGHAETVLAVTDFPALVYESKKGRYVLPNASDAENAKKVFAFIEDVKNGKIEKNLKSEPIPEANDESVKVVVGETFEQMVLTEDKDVLLEVYAPWCGHCKKLEPIYKELADSLKDVEHLVIAKMDGTANEAPVESFDWKGFPTLFFVKAGEKVPLKFDGARTLEGLTEYITKHSSKPIIPAVESAEKAKGEEL